MPSFLKLASVVIFATLVAACGDSSGQSTAGSAAAAAADVVGAVKDGAAKDDAAKDGAVKDVAAIAEDAQPASGGIDLAAGEQNYGRFCFSCHAAGVAGAPKLGDTEAWGPRVAKGLDALVASTIEGIPPGMPARGLCNSCTDADLRNTVAWMIEQ